MYVIFGSRYRISSQSSNGVHDFLDHSLPKDFLASRSSLSVRETFDFREPERDQKSCFGFTTIVSPSFCTTAFVAPRILKSSKIFLGIVSWPCFVIETIFSITIILSITNILVKSNGTYWQGLVEDVRTVFERLNDATLYIPILT